MGCINSTPDVIASSVKITPKINKISVNKDFTFANKEEEDDETFHSSIEKPQITFRANIGDKEFIFL